MTDLICTVCRRHRAALRRRQSKLLEGRTLFLCNECFEGKREPRSLVILVARDRKNDGLAKVRDYVINHRYYGDKIQLDELM